MRYNSAPMNGNILIDKYMELINAYSSALVERSYPPPFSRGS